MTETMKLHGLAKAREDMLGQSELYQPTEFWNAASQRIVEEIEEHGVEVFRSLKTPLSFFVPTYGSPGNSITVEQAVCLKDALSKNDAAVGKGQLILEEFLSGKAAAFADFRVLEAADTPELLPALHRYSESSFGNPIEQFEFAGRRFSRSALNYLLGLAFLKSHLAGEAAPKTVLEIGGGFGTLGEIYAASGIEDWRYIDVDIPPTSFVAEQYLRSAVGAENVTGYDQTHHLETITISDLPPASVFCAWQIEKLQGNIDLFVNFISFQEMEPAIVANYLSHVDRLQSKWILLRNMREGKQKRSDGHATGVETPILADDYLSMLSSYELVARNVIPFGFRTVDGFNSELFLFKRR